MLSKNIFHLMHKIALFAIVFASLAPSISHAVSAQNGHNTFTQEVCSSMGKKITIKVVTTKGQQLSTQLDFKHIDNREPVDIIEHLGSCPFCSGHTVDVFIQAPHTAVITLFALQAEQQAQLTQQLFSSFAALPPPAQAPPAL
jgi:hypothetical protein